MIGQSMYMSFTSDIMVMGNNAEMYTFGSADNARNYRRLTIHLKVYINMY